MRGLSPRVSPRLRVSAVKSFWLPMRIRPGNQADGPLCATLWEGRRVPTSMAKREKYQNRIELIQGTLDMLILQTLRWAPQHGYGISQAIRMGSGDILQVETGSLYPALHRLEKQGWIKSEWKTSEHNQRAKYYQLTASGKKHLNAEYSRWNQISTAIAGVMTPDGGESQA